MYTLKILDYTSEFIELAYDLGTLTRKHFVPAAVAVYVAAMMAFEYLMGLRGPTRHQMTQKLAREWRRIVALDPASKPEENLEFIWYLESLSDEELRVEFQSL